MANAQRIAKLYYTRLDPATGRSRKFTIAELYTAANGKKAENNTTIRTPAIAGSRLARNTKNFATIRIGYTLPLVLLAYDHPCKMDIRTPLSRFFNAVIRNGSA